MRHLFLPLLGKCTRSAGVLQHFRRVAPGGVGDGEAPQHAGDFVHALGRSEGGNGGERRVAAGLLGHAELERACTATCARWVTERTWWWRASDARSWPTTSATPPPMPEST